jgi:hypothetical protein
MATAMWGDAQPLTARQAPQGTPDVVVAIDSSYDGPYGGPMDAGAQARFDACWPAEAARRHTLQAMAQHLLLADPTEIPNHLFPERCICVWVWHPHGPLPVRHTAVLANGTLVRTEAGRTAPRPAWLPTDNGWSMSMEGRKTLETVHTRVDCAAWSWHQKLAFLDWARRTSAA